MNQMQRSMKISITIRLIIGALILLVLALGFNVLLSLNALEKVYVESIASQYSAIGKDLRLNLEQALRFGKNIRKFVGMDKILNETRRNIIRTVSESTSYLPDQEDEDFDISVSVALPDGSVFYSTEPALVGVTLSPSVMEQIKKAATTSDAADQVSYVKEQSTYITPLLIYDMKKQWVASAIIMFDESQVRGLLDRVQGKSVKLIVIILSSSVLLLILLLSVFTTVDTTARKFSKRRVTLIMLVVIGSAQLIFSILNTNDFRLYYLQINKEKTRMLATLLKEDIEFFFSKGLHLDKLLKMETRMGDIIAESPELDNIMIVDHEGLPYYLADKQQTIDFQKADEGQLQAGYRAIPVVDPAYNIRLKLIADDQVKGYVSANLSKDIIYRTLLEIGLDSTTILVISLLFFIELLILNFQFIESQIRGDVPAQKVHYSVIRPVAFLFFFGFDTSASFLPLQMEKLYEPMLGLSKDMVMGLPISARMFFAAISVFIGGIWLDHRGWKEPFLTGLFLTGMGLVYAWQAPNAIHFILSMCSIGMGFGLTMMAAQGFVIDNTDKAMKSQGLALLFAGFYAGSICGGATGAMLADRLGFSPVFLFGASFIFLALIYSLLFMRKAFAQESSSPEELEPPKASEPKLKMIQALRFVFNRNILGLVLLSGVPAAIAVIGFRNYFCPVYLNRIGISSSNIGRIFMIYGVCLIYVAPLVSKFIDKSGNARKYIAVSGLFASVGFLIFYLVGGIGAAAITSLLLGLSASFGSAPRKAYALKLKITQELGAGKAMGILNSTTRLGQVFGPLIFGWLILQPDIRQSVTYFGLAYLIVIVLFLLITQSDKKLAETKIALND